MSNEAPLPRVEIPPEALSPEALSGIIDEFILREGTDYGAHEVDHHAKISRVRRQIERREVKIVFDPNSESVTLLTLVEWQRTEKAVK